MDCPLWRMAALAALLGALGCERAKSLPLLSSNANHPPPLVTDSDPSAGASKEPEGPPRQPKPATCTAFATLREQMAADPKRSASERQQLCDEARRAYQQALKLDPKYLPALKGLAGLYTMIEDHPRAVEAHRRAVQAYPQDAEAWFRMGMCHARQKEWQHALEGLHKAVTLDPENRQYVNAYGFCLARTGRYEDSFTVLRTAGGDAQAHYNLARMLLHLNMDEPSKEHLRLALAKNPKLDDARVLLSRLENPTAGVENAGHQENPAAAPAPVQQTGYQGN